MAGKAFQETGISQNAGKLAAHIFTCAGSGLGHFVQQGGAAIHDAQNIFKIVATHEVIFAAVVEARIFMARKQGAATSNRVKSRTCRGCAV